jgi:hypothetical protein
VSADENTSILGLYLDRYGSADFVGVEIGKVCANCDSVTYPLVSRTFNRLDTVHRTDCTCCFCIGSHKQS